MTPEEFLAANWLFTRDELARALHSRGRRSPRTVSSHLARWQRLGRVTKVKEGVYLRRPGSQGSTPAPIDFLALASKMARDAVLAYHTALEIHGYAQSLFESLVFLTRSKTKPLRFQGRQFVPVKPPTALARMPGTRAWVEVAERTGIEVKVTSLERTVVDVLDRPDLSGGVEEVWRSCLQIPALDMKPLEAYVRRLHNRTLAAKVGYFLDCRSQELLVPVALAERLQALAPRGPVYVDRRAGGRLVARWRLIVPEAWIPDEGEPAT